jgi:hypothetical protein
VYFIGSKRYVEVGMKWAARESLPTERALLQQEKEARRNKALTENPNKRKNSFPADSKRIRDRPFKRIFMEHCHEQERAAKMSTSRHRKIGHTKVSGTGYGSERHAISNGAASSVQEP